MTIIITVMETRLPVIIKIQALTRGSPTPITIHTQDQQEIQVPEGATELRIMTNYRSGEVTPLFQVSGIRQGLYQRITVDGIWVNGQALRDHDRFIRQQISHNRYQRDRLITGEKEIAFNGGVALDTRWARRWDWTMWYRSGSRWDWVYDNTRTDCGSELAGCWDGECGDPERTTHLDHLRQWANTPHDPWDATGTYDHGCFGCSVTQGSAIRRGDQWPSLLPGTNINLAQAGAGVDAIWMNLERAIRSFHMDRIILLLPSWHRRLERTHRHGETLRMPITVMSRATPPTEPCSAWWHTQDREAMRHRGQRLLVRRDHRRRGLRIVDRIRYLLEGWGGRYWIGSHDPEVHQDLERLSVMGPRNLLPLFDNDLGAVDGQHPSAQAHQRWIHEILPLIR